MQNPLNLKHPQKVALVEEDRRSYSYAEIDANIRQFANAILADRSDLELERIAFLIPASVEYVTVLHGIWLAGGIAVPLHVASAEAELQHCLSSVGVSRLFVDSDSKVEQLKPSCDRLSIEVMTVQQMFSFRDGNDHDDDKKKAKLPSISPDRRAMILFTSGTTGKPKGVVSTHKNIKAQITALLTAWQWKDQDVIPLFLPLHHIHGIVNILSCALWSGATVHLFPKLNLDILCAQIAEGTYTVFMAVPTVYVKIIDYLREIQDDNDGEKEKKIRDGFGSMRLNVSGSAACPVELFEKWRQLTGQTLLERYGMTEIGMALSNPYNGERRAGCVGQVLPGVKVILCDEDHQLVTEESTPGEIRVKGNNVFLEYWNNPDATDSSFRDGWFCTGDVAVMENGYYRILGRSSVDIIKSGGYKLSALEIEGVLLTHPDVFEVAVVGIRDRVWGEAVAAAVVLRSRDKLEIEELKSWCQDKMSKYKIPKRLVVTHSLPRNAMGKVNKPKLKELF